MMGGGGGDGEKPTPALSYFPGAYYDNAFFKIHF